LAQREAVEAREQAGEMEVAGKRLKFGMPLRFPEAISQLIFLQPVQLVLPDDVDTILCARQTDNRQLKNEYRVVSQLLTLIDATPSIPPCNGSTNWILKSTSAFLT
jgi:hypothetical protein